MCSDFVSIETLPVIDLSVPLNSEGEEAIGLSGTPQVPCELPTFRPLSPSGEGKGSP